MSPRAGPRFGEEKNLLPFRESNQISYPISHIPQSEKGVWTSNIRSTMHCSDLILQSLKMLLLINFELNIIHARPLYTKAEFRHADHSTDNTTLNRTCELTIYIFRLPALIMFINYLQTIHTSFKSVT